jgi:putative endonuclease
MAFNKTLYVYIMASKTGTLYVGMTDNINRRVYEHKHHLISGFTDKYKVDRLIYLEAINDPASAINREKQIKAWRREKKIALIDSVNPPWNDLSQDWYE